jgi:hypothetical protein
LRSSFAALRRSKSLERLRMRILALSRLQNFARSLLNDAKGILLYGIGALAASACSGRHPVIIRARDSRSEG